MVTLAITPAVKLDERLKKKLLAQVREQRMVIVHCNFTAVCVNHIRIWKTTFLIDEESGNRSQLLHALNILFAPEWMFVPTGTTVHFTLIFEALPKTCQVFDLLEDITESGGFYIKGIRRKKSDVYHVTIGE